MANPFFFLRSKEKAPEIERRIKVNDAEYNAQFEYAHNRITTSKYNVVTFLPKNLFEQFQRLANAYFLGLLILQLIPPVSSLNPVATIIPLVFVLSISAIKEAIDDFMMPTISSLAPYTTSIPLVCVLTITTIKDGMDDHQRHRSDDQVNNRTSYVLRHGELVEERWYKVSVGDIIKLKNNDFVAADLMVLSTSEPHSLCYIETAELDGETNLKVRQALEVTAEMADDHTKMAAFDAEIISEPPNNRLSKFEGKMHWRGETYSLDNEKILLRGCVLRNTEWCYGVVIFAGQDTKLMMNSGKTTFKRTNIDRFMNKLIIGIFFFLITVCLICMVASGVWEGMIGYDFQAFLPWEYFIRDDKGPGALSIALLVFLSYIIILNTVVPISLYVSVEIIRLAHSLWINWDIKMYYEKKDTCAKARTTTLNEELGQIEYIFSDKTGTLTQNIMTFNKCSINGKSYGDPVDTEGNLLEISEIIESLRWRASAASRRALSLPSIAASMEFPLTWLRRDSRRESWWSTSSNEKLAVWCCCTPHLSSPSSKRCLCPCFERHAGLGCVPEAQTVSQHTLIDIVTQSEQQTVGPSSASTGQLSADLSLTGKAGSQTVPHGQGHVPSEDSSTDPVFVPAQTAPTTRPRVSWAVLPGQIDQTVGPASASTGHLSADLPQTGMAGSLTVPCGQGHVPSENRNTDPGFVPAHAAPLTRPRVSWAVTPGEIDQAGGLSPASAGHLSASLSLSEKTNSLMVPGPSKESRLPEKTNLLMVPDASKESSLEHVPPHIAPDLRRRVSWGQALVKRTSVFAPLSQTETWVVFEEEEKKDVPKVDFSENPYAEKNFDFYDQDLLNIVRAGDKNCHTFFLTLALCHTVMSETLEDGTLEYQAQSPDEGALVSAARNFGFVFKTRTPSTITIEVHGKQEVYELLCILDFNNVRKRMSVIVRKDNKIKLFCKGADNVIFERLSPACDDLKELTTHHLNDFAQSGLRTLCLAVKDIEPAVYEKWKVKHHEASTAMEGRDDQLDAVYEEIETNLELVGASAIEDKLQDGVPETISNLALANIKIWVLTGDKQETAINIGYSCRLLTDEMEEPFVVDAESMEEVEGQLRQALEEVHKATVDRSNSDHLILNGQTITINGNTGTGTTTEFEVIEDEFGEFALVINGHSLAYALKPELEGLFLEVACLCKSVICCRVTPLQKALVVDLVKRHKKTITLAIGDGANDVSMIKMAHIGIGISGQEGMQAVLASDYSIAQFRYVERLLLVHGRWSYLRMCKFLKYFFYKNFAFTLCHFWFAFFCGFSAQTLFDPYFISLYNVFYTSLPILILGIFDQDVDDIHCVRFPKLYLPGQSNELFNIKVFSFSVLEGILSSITLFFIPYGALITSLDEDGIDKADLQSFGTVVAATLVVAVNLKCALDMNYWTGFNHFVVWGSIIYYFCFQLAFYSEAIVYEYVGAAFEVFGNPATWFIMLLTCTILIMPRVAIRFYQSSVHPTLSDRVRLRQRMRKSKSKGRELHVRRQSTFRRSARSIRSGYAFAHQAGFGELITSGLNMKERAKDAVSPVRLTKVSRNNSASSPTQDNEAFPGKSGQQSNMVPEASQRQADSASTVDSCSHSENWPQGKTVLVERL